MPKKVKRRGVARVRTPDEERQKYNRELGERLKVARKGARLESDDVAKALGVPPNTYLKWERGDRQFPMHLILPFCKMTKFPPGFVVTGRPTEEITGYETGKFRKPALAPDDE